MHVEQPLPWTVSSADGGWSPVSDVHAAIQMAVVAQTRGGAGVG